MKSKATVHDFYLVADNYIQCINLSKRLYIYMYIKKNYIILDFDYNKNSIWKATYLAVWFYYWVK